MKDSLIVLSGGMDSTTLLYEYRERIAVAISFNYGSNHNTREIDYAHKNCEKLNIRHIIIELPFVQQYFNSSLLQGAEAIPEGHYASENMKSTVVPFRNGIMLSIACGIAESNGLKQILIANHGGDHAIYPDCRSEFIESMSKAMQVGTYEEIRIVAPYTDKDKTYIAKRGSEIGVDFSLTYSCYKGGNKHCGKCGTCVERKEAFELAGVVDPTEYQS